MTNTELKNKLTLDRKTKFNKVLTVDELYHLYENDKLDISIFERTETGNFENVDDRLVSNYKFVKSTRVNVDSIIRCIVNGEGSEKEVKKFILSPGVRIDLTIKGDVLLEDKLPFGGSTNFYLKLKIID